MRKRNSRCRLPSFLCGYAPYAENHWLKTTTVPKAKRNISPRELYRKKRVRFIDNCNYSGFPTAFTVALNSYNKFIYRSTASCQAGSREKPFATSFSLLIRLFFGRFAFTGNSPLFTGVTETLSMPAARKISLANSYQLQIPSLVAW